MSVLQRMWEPLGGWRTQLLYRLFGLCLFDYTLIKYASSDLIAILTFPEWEFHGLALSGLLLAVAGARLLAIALAWAWTLICFGIVLSGTYQLLSFPAAEWTIVVLLPLFTCPVVMVAMTRWAVAGEGSSGTLAARYRTEVDWSVTATFRVMGAAVLGFAALHKINTDFFDPTVSCIGLKDRLTEWWQVPSFVYGWIKPAHIIGAEASAPLLLFFLPEIGIPLTILLVSLFNSIGAPAFAGLVVTMALAFLPHDAGAVILRGARRFWPWASLAIAAVVAAGKISYRAAFPWLPMAIGQVLALTALCCSLFYAVTRIQRLVDGAERRAAPPSGPATPPPAALRICIAGVALLCLLNGLTPYLGLKFEYSFAMLSNLRVDDDRWNSLIFPRSMRLADHDPFVHVHRVRYKKLPAGPSFEQGGILDPKIYSPSAVRYGVRVSLARGVGIAFDCDYQGRSYRFVDDPDPRKFYAWVTRLPETPLIQKMLEAGTPQICMH